MMCFMPVVAAVVLAAGPSQGLFLGVPPGPADPVIENVAPPQCLFYVNWAGTRAPSAASGSETEKLLAEPEVQEFLKAISKVISVWLKEQDEEAKTPGDQAAAALKETATELDLSYQEAGELLHLLLTRPTAVFLADVKVEKPRPAEAGPDDEADAVDSEDVEIHGGLVIALGADAPRWREKLHKLVEQERKKAPDSVERIERGGETWYRTRPTELGDKNPVTFGFHGNYFVLAVGEGTVEGMLARWKGPPPSWLTKALAQTEVPRRTGIVYLNVKMMRDKLLPLAEDLEEALGTLKLFGLDNVDSIVFTTGLDDDGMIGRTLLALDGKPHGLLDLVSDRPLVAADLEPIPSNALLALAARFDLERSFNVLVSAVERSAELSDFSSDEIRKHMAEALERSKKEHGIDVHRLLSAVGDTWCVYNSPTEGEVAFLGWTAVVSVRDRAALVEGWEKLCAFRAKSKGDKKDAAEKEKEEEDSISLGFKDPWEFRKCRFAGHDVYYVAKQAIAPAFCISDRQMVMTLNMPAMKAYLTRKDHRSLATVPGVASALKDGKGPAGLWYSDSPRLFDFYYPLISLFGTAAAGAAQEAGVDLEPTYWPSAPAIRAHLRPDVSTLERTPAGLQVTSRYSLPSLGAGELMWLMILSGLVDNAVPPSLPEMLPVPNPLGEPDSGASLTPPSVVVPMTPLTRSPLRAKPTERNQPSQVGRSVSPD